MPRAWAPCILADMMGDAVKKVWVEYADYLALEQSTGLRHEWLDGQVYAMAGGTLAHGALSAAMIGELRNLALGCGCQVFSADAKVRVIVTGLATYPDASVVCGDVVTRPDDPNALTNPSLLVEVLSDSTAGYDRGDKFEHYQHLASLKDYVLVSQYQKRVEVYSRDDTQRWVLRIALAGESVPLTAMPGSLDVDRVYQGITLTPTPLKALPVT